MEKIKEALIELLREDMEYKEGDPKEGTYYSQWVFGVAIRELTPTTYLCRTAIKTSESEYVDGTDIMVRLVEGKMVLDLSFVEEEPILNGSPAIYAIDWIKQVKGSVDYIRLIEPKDIKTNNYKELSKKDEKDE